MRICAHTQMQHSGDSYARENRARLGMPNTVGYVPKRRPVPKHVPNWCPILWARTRNRGGRS